MPYATLRDKKTELIRKARDGSVFIAAYSADGITTLTTGTNTNEIQHITITGTPTGGTFRITYAGQQTATIPYNATAGAVQTALEALSNITTGDVTVTGGPGPGTPWVVTFGGTLGFADVAAMTTTDAFTRDQLLAGNKTALMLHGVEHSDMAMDRVACGVIGPAS